MNDEMGSVCLTSKISNITIQTDNPQYGSLVKYVGDYSPNLLFLVLILLDVVVS